MPARKLIRGIVQGFQPESNPQQPTSLQHHCHRLRDDGRERVWRLIAQRNAACWHELRRLRRAA
jgi:hypothetical protein